MGPALLRRGLQVSGLGVWGAARGPWGPGCGGPWPRPSDQDPQTLHAEFSLGPSGRELLEGCAAPRGRLSWALSEDLLAPGGRGGAPGGPSPGRSRWAVESWRPGRRKAAFGERV